MSELVNSFKSIGEGNVLSRAMWINKSPGGKESNPKTWVDEPCLATCYPRTKLFYHKENLNPVNKYTITLTASSFWLSTAAYPRHHWPHRHHNADSNFLPARWTESPTPIPPLHPIWNQLVPKRPKTLHVLLLHFNEASGSTQYQRLRFYHSSYHRQRQRQHHQRHDPTRYGQLGGVWRRRPGASSDFITIPEHWLGHLGSATRIIQ